MEPANEIFARWDWPRPVRPGRSWRVAAVSCGISAAFNAILLAVGHWLLLPSAEPSTLMLAVPRGPSSVESAPRVSIRPTAEPRVAESVRGEPHRPEAPAVEPRGSEARRAEALARQVDAPPIVAPGLPLPIDGPSQAPLAVAPAPQAVHVSMHRQANTVRPAWREAPPLPAMELRLASGPASMGHGRDIEPRVHPPREVHLPRRPVQRPELPELAAHEVSVAAPASVAVHGAEVESPPRIAFNPAPAYPPDALAAGATGLVELRVRVAADGRVLAVALHRTSGHASLDRAALEAVRQWRFHPAQRDGVATQHEVIVPVRFRLRQ